MAGFSACIGRTGANNAMHTIWKQMSNRAATVCMRLLYCRRHTVKAKIPITKPQICRFDSTSVADRAMKQLMFSRIGMSAVLGIALFVAPAQPSAASCILINAPSEKACNAACCANKTCCETSQKNTAPPVQPLAKSGSNQQTTAALPATLAVALLDYAATTKLPIFSSAEFVAHSPAPLTLICIRLI